MAPSERNQNMVPSLTAKSNAGDNADVIVWADPSTHRLLVNASVTVGAVSGDRTSNTAVPGATNLGVLAGIATAAAPSYTEGYLVGLSTDLSGALRVTGSLSVGGTTDNSAFTAGSSTGTPAMGFYHSTIDAVTDGRAAAVAITAKRAMMVNLQTSAGVETGVAAAPLQVSLENTAANATAIKVNVASGGIASGAVASGAIASGAVASGAFASGSISSGAIAAGAIAAGATSIADNEDVASADGDRGVKVLAVRKATPANTSGTDGDYEFLQMSAGRIWASANIDQINGVTPLMGAGNTGTGSLRVTLATDQAALAAWGLGATGAAVPAGAQYDAGIARTSNPSAATEGNLTGVLMDKLGKQIVVGSIRDLKVNQVTTITTSTSETTVLTAVASTFLDVYGVIVTNTSATAVTVAFKDSTAGTTQFNIAVPAGETRGFMLPEGGAIKQGTVNNNWTATTQSVTSVIITMLAVKNI